MFVSLYLCVCMCRRNGFSLSSGATLTLFFRFVTCYFLIDDDCSKLYLVCFSFWCSFSIEFFRYIFSCNFFFKKIRLQKFGMNGTRFWFLIRVFVCICVFEWFSIAFVRSTFIHYILLCICMLCRVLYCKFYLVKSEMKVCAQAYSTETMQLPFNLLFWSHLFCVQHYYIAVRFCFGSIQFIIHIINRFFRLFFFLQKIKITADDLFIFVVVFFATRINKMNNVGIEAD